MTQPAARREGVSGAPLSVATLQEVETLTKRQIVAYLQRCAKWREELQGLGYYGAGVDMVQSQIRSTRRGRPTESTAIRFAELSARLREIDAWLVSLTPPERTAARYYTEDRPDEWVAMSLGLMLTDARQLVRSIPLLIQVRFYPAESTGS